MTRLIYIIIIAVTAALIPAAAIAATPTAAAVLKKSADNLNSSPSLSLKFSMSEGADKSTGNLKLSGDKFVATIDNGITTWYDGTTQWVYNPKTDEITVTTPTPDELATINPFVIVTNLQKSYKARHLKAPAGKYVIELTPLSKNADIKKAVITIDNRYSPLQAAITLSNGHTAVIKVISITKGAKIPQANFSPDKKKYQSAEWIDLR